MLLINGEIWTMDGDALPKGYVQVQDGRITGVGPMESRPMAGEDEEIIELGGRLVLPGFVDAHSHMGLYSTASGMEGDDINEDADPCTPHLRALDGIDPLDEAFGDARRWGVTCAVISPGSANPIAGQVCAVKTRGRWIDRMAVAQPVAVKLALGENPKMTYGQKPQSPVTRMGTAALIREHLQKARRYLRDIEKAEADDELDLPEFDARLEALLPLLRREIPAHIHAHKAYDILTGLRICEEFGLRCVIVHATEGYQISDILAKRQVDAICGPMICARTKPELAGQTIQNCMMMAKAGVRVAISTDHPEVPGEYLLMSASMAHSAGMGLEQVLRAITIDAARIAGLEERIGSITPGKDADLLVFSGDLMRVGAKPDMICVDGIWIE